ncbi:MAG: hypothetical protein ACRD3J_24280 [Thermoanaerobaculia bacterium]
MNRESFSAVVITVVLGIAALWLLKSTFDFVLSHIFGVIVLTALLFTAAGILLYLNQRKLGTKNH